MENTNNTLFDKQGRRIPFGGMRVYNEDSMSYYKLKQPKIDFDSILSNSQKFSGVGSTITVDSFETVCEELKNKVMGDTSLNNLFEGVCVPFICPKSSGELDLGTEMEQVTLPSVASSFKASFPDLHCKATLQGSSKLAGELSVTTDSRYDGFLEAHKKGAVAGWYFPQALQEYDIASQRVQMNSLPESDFLVLSGGVDISAALIGSPGLLINEDDYPPVLCLSALEHADDKLMLCFKAYGQHLEFWCMSQMLAPGVTQVSEQWSGGLTLFASVS
jgi:hypothetical protein